MPRRRFGYVRKLPSGSFQASFTPPSGQRKTGSTTFRTAADAGRYLDRVELDIKRGHWQQTEGWGNRTHREWCAAWMEENPRGGKLGTET